MFKNKRIYIIKEKISETSLNATQQLIKRFGGTIAKDQKDSIAILTSMKSPARIKRHLDCFQVPVVDVQWIKDCINGNNLLPIQNYIILSDSSPISKQTTKDSQELHSSLSSDNILTKKFTESIPDTLKLPNKIDQNFTGYSTNLDPSFINTRYECSRPTKLDQSYNPKIVAYLSLLKKSRELESNDKSSLAYSHAISAIKAYPRKISSATEAEKIKGVGPKIKEMIHYYLEHGTIPEAEKLLSDVRFRTLRLFTKCFGVGPKSAVNWWDMGYRCLQDVLDNALLTTTVKLGIQLLPDFIIKMNREDVEELVKIIGDHVKKIDNNLFVTPVGGYRRGKTTSSDLDIIISYNDITNMKDIFNQTLITLEQNEYIKHVLWKSDGLDHSQRSRSKQFDVTENLIKSIKNDPGLDDLPKMIVAFMQPSKGVLRQVDLIFASKEQYPFALLAWTGSKQFEISIRDYAKNEKNIKLSSNHMLTRTTPEKSIKVNTEEEIFYQLGLPFLNSIDRNC